MTAAHPPVADPMVIHTGPSPRGWHRLQLAAECLQKYAWFYEGPEKLDISKKRPLVIGGLVHLSLAQHYARMQQQQEGKNPNEYMDPVEAVRLVAEVEGNQRYIELVVETYKAYRKHYFGDIRTRRIVAVETLFDGVIRPNLLEALAQAVEDNPESYRLTGRLDLMYEDLAGNLWAEDHKTTGRLTKKHPEYFALSGQLLGYEHLVRQTHPELMGFQVNLIQHAAAGTPKFQRIRLPRRPALEQQFLDRAVDIERSIERIRQEGRAVHQWPKAMSELVCYHRYGACPHIDRCKFGPGAKKAGNWTWVP